MTAERTLPERIPFAQIGTVQPPPPPAPTEPTPDTLTGKWAADGMKQLRTLLAAIAEAESNIVQARHEAEGIARALTSFGLEVPDLPWLTRRTTGIVRRTGQKRRRMPADATCQRCGRPVQSADAFWRSTRQYGEGYYHRSWATCAEATQ